MELIDDQGYLFGTINVIDALAVVLVLAVVTAGTAFVLSNDQATEEEQQRVTVELEIKGVQPYIADAIPTGTIRNDGVAAIENKSVHPTKVIINDQNGTLHEREHPRKQTVRLHVTLNSTSVDGEPQFAGSALEVGRQLTFDLGPVTVKGTVTEVESRTDA